MIYYIDRNEEFVDAFLLKSASREGVTLEEAKALGIIDSHGEEVKLGIEDKVILYKNIFDDLEAKGINKTKEPEMNEGEQANCIMLYLLIRKVDFSVNLIGKVINQRAKLSDTISYISSIYFADGRDVTTRNLNETEKQFLEGIIENAENGDLDAMDKLQYVLSGKLVVESKELIKKVV